MKKIDMNDVATCKIFKCPISRKKKELAYLESSESCDSGRLKRNSNPAQNHAQQFFFKMIESLREFLS